MDKQIFLLVKERIEERTKILAKLIDSSYLQTLIWNELHLTPPPNPPQWCSQGGGKHGTQTCVGRFCLLSHVTGYLYCICSTEYCLGYGSTKCAIVALHTICSQSSVDGKERSKVNWAVVTSDSLILLFECPLPIGNNRLSCTYITKILGEHNTFNYTGMQSFMGQRLSQNSFVFLS